MKKILLVIVFIISIINLSACKSTSAYELYLNSYIQAAGSKDGAMTEEEWLESLKGERGVGISQVEIICGNIIISYTDGSQYSINNAYPEAGHQWDSGVITTAPTCLTTGAKTYTCEKCLATKKEIIDAVADNHIYTEYGYDAEYHWSNCQLCGNKKREMHNFTGVTNESDANDLIKCECGLTKTVGEIQAFKVNFVCSDGVTIKVYASQNYSEGGEESNIAYSRSKTGELLKNGEGQVNFEIIPHIGYKLGSISISPENGYKNFKGKEETGSDNIYRITKITANLTVTINMEFDALNMPIISINTENDAVPVDKENYINCNISVSNAENGYNFSNASAGIRLRGNTTMTYPKKPYRIKFDKKQQMFGFGEYKSWVLLALYLDFSNIKDYAAFNFAKSIKRGNAFVPNAQHVEVYFNGEYQGLYLLTEQVQENIGRVGVESEFGEEREVPFLVELDEYAPVEGTEGIDWFKIYNPDITNDAFQTSFYTIKYPEAEQRYNQEQFNYIEEYINKVNSLCHSQMVTKEEFEEYIDLDQFIDYYLIQEFMGQGDIVWKSVYMSKSKDGKLVMGPIWDFDWAVTGPISFEKGQRLGFNYWYSEFTWFYLMLQRDWFLTATCNRWKEIRETLNQKITELESFKETIKPTAERNAILWDFLDDGDPENDFSGYYDCIIDFMQNRWNWMNEQLGKEN